MIVVIAGKFPVCDHTGQPTGRYEFVASHGVDFATGRSVILPGEPPLALGAEMHEQLSEWVLYENDTDRALYEYLIEN
jgi:hypothetical protein